MCRVRLTSEGVPVTRRRRAGPGRFPLEKITTHKFGLQDADLAIRSVGNAGVPGVIHASLLPWQ